jgi:hypothetical protein
VGLYREDGSRITKSALDKTAVGDPDPEFTINETVFETFRLEGEKPGEGQGDRVKFHEGQVVKQSEIDAAYPAAAAPGALVPATGAAAGGTVVQINGTNLDGVTGVSFGGAAGTALTVTPERVTVTTPAHAAGAVSVVITDDSGVLTKTNAFTYT